MDCQNRDGENTTRCSSSLNHRSVNKGTSKCKAGNREKRGRGKLLLSEKNENILNSSPENPAKNIRSRTPPLAYRRRNRSQSSENIPSNENKICYKTENCAKNKNMNSNHFEECDGISVVVYEEETITNIFSNELEKEGGQRNKINECASKKLDQHLNESMKEKSHSIISSSGSQMKKNCSTFSRSVKRRRQCELKTLESFKNKCSNRNELREIRIVENRRYKSDTILLEEKSRSRSMSTEKLTSQNRKSASTTKSLSRSRCHKRSRSNSSTRSSSQSTNSEYLERNRSRSSSWNKDHINTYTCKDGYRSNFNSSQRRTNRSYSKSSSRSKSRSPARHSITYRKQSFSRSLSKDRHITRKIRERSRSREKARQELMDFMLGKQVSPSTGNKKGYSTPNFMVDLILGKQNPPQLTSHNVDCNPGSFTPLYSSTQSFRSSPSLMSAFTESIVTSESAVVRTNYNGGEQSDALSFSTNEFSRNIMTSVQIHNSESQFSNLQNPQGAPFHNSSNNYSSNYDGYYNVNQPILNSNIVKYP